MRNGKHTNGNDKKGQGQLRERTYNFALRVIRVVDALPTRRSADILGTQLLRSGTSVGANYRAACRARSAKEFCAKLGVVEEEADESVVWMSLISDAGIMKRARLEKLIQEGNEIVAMVVASIKTTRRTIKNTRKKN
jgi:four helix bundle protein